MSESGAQPDRQPLPLEVEQQIDRVSDEFERAWKAGQTPRIEDYLDRVPAVGRSRLLEELLVVEFDLRQQSGQPLDVDSYRQRFPGSDVVINAAMIQREQRKQDDLPRTARQPAVKNLEEDEQPLPKQVGRFLIKRLLGKGGFGVVYLAHDPGLDRLVALKVPRPELLATGQQRESFLHEARTAAKLKHAALVTVYEVQQEGELIHIVQEYIEGENLAQWAAAQPRSWEDITHRFIEIATAIGHVHQQGFYHRDLKPGNILIDNDGHAHVADFGLAVHEDALRMLKGKASGTPQYMSPEQVRGETHWIDDRTDIWALGVILYELLSGHRPFTAPDRLELFEEIQERDPKSPRTKNPAIPKELERICLKCLAKRRTHRYANASDLLEDLQAFLETCADSEAAAATDRAAGVSVAPGSGGAVGTGSTIGPNADSTPRQLTPTPDSGSQPPLRIIPKGLRSFDEDDKDFFLELLPGPRDREGLPDTIRFWKTRIEKTDADATFAVGVMYGPSGCGKSSLLKAGLLPRLADHVLPIFIEATPNDTELRLLKMLRKHIPRLAVEASLAEALAQLREGRVTEGRKVLLVLDQFEQWLHATPSVDGSQLVRALRQCDGANVQCLILVRDDFWMSTTRFMQSLEILQLEGMNSAAVDLFDPSHARKVLRAFGLAYGRLPEHDLSADEQRFLDRAVQDLAHDGKVICVQLSLFADMMKGRPWTPASLHEVGGTSGVGVAFLDETFTSKTAPPTHRLHAKAAQAVLKALLPDVGTDIKGQMQPAERLLECSGYANRPDDFRDLLQILNSEVRLITPTEPEEAEAGAGEPASAAADRRFYQLTHDYLVPSLRDWLTRKQKETRRGRAQLRLTERSALWTSKPEKRNFPSWWEYLNIRLLTRRREWTPPQQTMMRQVGKFLGMRACMALLVLLGVGIGIERFRAYVRDEHVRIVVAAMSNSRGIQVPRDIDALRVFPPHIVAQELERRFETAEDDRKLRLAYALADPDFGQVNRVFLIGAIGGASADECDNIVTALGHDRESSVQDLRQAAVEATSKRDWKLKTRLATVALYLNDTSIAAEMLQAEPPTTEQQPAAEAKPDWHDPHVDPDWPPVADATKSAIDTGHGVLEERFGFCLDMPWDTFLATKDVLGVSHYRPIRVRPFVHEGRRLVAAVWTRDALKFQLECDQRPDQLPSFDTPATREGFVPIDVAAYSVDGGGARYCVLWSQPTAKDEKCHLRVGMTQSEWEAAVARMREAGLTTQVTLQAFVSADGTRRYAGIWSTAGDETQANPVMEPPKTGGYEVIWTDVSVAARGTPPHPLDVLRERLTMLTQLPPAQQEPPPVCLERAKAHYYLDQPQDAIADLDILVAQSSPIPGALLYSALCKAQLGQGEEARATAAKLLEAEPTGYGPIGQILIPAWLGEIEEAQRGLNDHVTQCADNPMALYNAACVAAQLTRILKDRDPAELVTYKQRALELLRRAYEKGQSGNAGIENDPDFIPLWEEPEFQQLLGELVGNRCYTGVWGRGNQVESWVDSGLSLDEQQQAARQRAATAFRPVAAAVSVLPDSPAPETVVMWQRPRVIPPPWDPVQRTTFIEWFPKWSGNVGALKAVMDAADDASLRSGISLALGSIGEVSAETKKVWEPVLVDWHTRHPDSGVHSAAGWALRSWGLSPPPIESKDVREGFNWRVTKMGLTLIRIPAGEVQGATDESGQGRGKRIRIPQDFWLSDREATAGQFKQFLNDKDAEKPDKPEEIAQTNTGDPSLPVVQVNWYDAAMFCNWLSRQEGREPCYLKEGKEQIRDYDNKTREYDAWKLIPGANGYRLPTEDEWEYACRAKTTTAFSFGDAEDLLDRYAVFVKNMKTGPDSVGRKPCNAWGLFDMHGNVWEWCQDWNTEGSFRVNRGGSWYSPASLCQSAFRSRALPILRDCFLGFRVAAVPSASPASPASPARGAESGSR